MAFISSSISVKIQLLDGSHNAVYTGTPGNGIFVWGAQLEFEQNFEAARQDFYNFRYIRTTGASASFIGTRLGLDNTADSTPINDKLNILYGFRLGTYQDGRVKDPSDINITYNSYGLLRMTSYVGIDYIAEDYVGDSRVFTY